MNRIKEALTFLPIMKYGIYVKIFTLKYNYLEIKPDYFCIFQDLGQEDSCNNEAPSVCSVVIHCSSSVPKATRKISLPAQHSSAKFPPLRINSPPEHALQYRDL